MIRTVLPVLGLLAALIAAPAGAQEAVIRKTISERMPTFPKIDEITKTAIPGIYELRMGIDVVYSDAKGEHLIQGELLETRTGVNLTEARLDKLTAIDVTKLNYKDAIVWKQGTGARKLVVFADPNCGYCKRFEAQLQQVKDITVYTFLYPILGGDSPEKSRDIWCAKDSTKAWRDWMLNGTAPTSTASEKCDVSAIERNASVARKHRINGTPALVFEDGKRVAGALGVEAVEKQLLASLVK
jgi:thiol:disulfide interchange protein DsbC